MILRLSGYFTASTITAVKSAFLMILRGQDDKVYELTMLNIGKIPVYCHMSNSGLGECGGGALVMKKDGTRVPLQTELQARPLLLAPSFLSILF